MIRNVAHEGLRVLRDEPVASATARDRRQEADGEWSTSRCSGPRAPPDGCCVIRSAVAAVIPYRFGLPAHLLAQTQVLRRSGVGPERENPRHYTSRSPPLRSTRNGDLARQRKRAVRLGLRWHARSRRPAATRVV